MNVPKFKQLLSELRACSAAREWAEGKDLKIAWDTCERGDWLLWLAGRMADKPGWATRKAIVSVACDCAELALPYAAPGEMRPAECIRVVRTWVKGEATIEQVRTARNDAASAADFASDAYYAAAASAASAASDADFAYAASAADFAYAAYSAAYSAASAASAADDAAYAAYAASAADAADAAYAAREKVREQCAKFARKALRPDGI